MTVNNVKALIAGGMSVALAACVPTANPPQTAPAAPETAGQCNAAPLADFVGQAATAEIGQQALTKSGSRSLRWLQPNSMMTMDYRQDRLNIKLDANNLITEFTCD